MKIRIGASYQVSEGSGLDSRRIGKAIDPRGHSIAFFYRIEPGRYKNFDHRRECLLIDPTRQYFTMFKNRLIPILTPKK